MRLISCHIEKFGKLSDENISFNDISGINVLCENNGWGKSTLAAFIKVMFFGFDNEGRRNSVENERQRFKPWQGGVYGGQLTFESGGARYTILRTFGTKEKDDGFILQDADSKLETADFSKNIGEELFQIDRASFARSIYISQNDCATKATDRINAKLGNLTDNTDDLNNYETAAKKIADRLNSLSKTRKTGELYKQKEKISELKHEIKKGEAIDTSMEGVLKLKGELLSSYETLREKRGMLQDKQKEISEYKDILVKKKEYGQLCADEEKKRRVYEEKKALFPGRIPEDEEVGKYADLEYHTSVLKKNLELIKPGDDEVKQLGILEMRFSEGVPESADIEEVKGKVSDMQAIRRGIEKNMLTDDEAERLKLLEGLFAAGIPEEEEISGLLNTWSLRCEKKNTLSTKQATVEMLKMTKEENERSRREREGAKDRPDSGNGREGGEKTYLPYVVFGILAVIGLALCLAVPLAGIGVITLDIAILITYVIFAKKNADTNRYRRQNDRNRAADSDTGAWQDSAADADAGAWMGSTADSDARAWSASTADSTNDVPAYLKLQREIEEDEQLIHKIESDVKQFFASYKIPYEEGCVVSNLYQLKENAGLYGRLLEKSRGSEEQGLKERYDMLQREVEGFLGKYGRSGRGYGRVAGNGEEAEDSRVADYGQGTGEVMMYGGMGENAAEDTLEYYVNQLYKLESAADKYKALKTRKADYEKSYGEYKQNLETINSFIKDLKMEAGGDLTSKLNFIKEARDGYFRAESEYREAAGAKEKYETDNAGTLDAIKNTKEVEEDASLSEIENRLSEISEEIEKYHTSVAAYNRQLDELQEKRDEITESEASLVELQELYEANEKKLEVLKKTQKYLEQAKISLTAKYTKPVKDGFDKYFGILCDIECENYQLDANLELSAFEQGMPRDTAFLSAGYRDMIGICMRMALIDAMYKDEKPFVIFDDPFVNLDSGKTAAALEILEVIAKEYQVIYFTCNESRKIS